MGSTKKELDNISKSHTRYLYLAIVRLERLLRPVSRLVFRLGFMRRLHGQTIGGRVGTISRYAARGEHDKAADLSIEMLKEYRHQPAGTWRISGRDYWWMFMHFAARSLEQCGDRKKQDEVIELARAGIEPFIGYYVALSFLAFSRWKYREGEHDAAIAFAEIAARADDTWAEPDFVLGWYRLMLGGGDAMEYFARAVRKDHRIGPRIANDPVCRRHPHIIQKLKALSEDRIVTVRNGPAADERDATAD